MKRVLLVLVVLAGCSGVGSDATTTIASLPESTTTSVANVPGTSEVTVTTDTRPPTTTSTTVPSLEVSIEDGVVTGIDLLQVSLGDTIDVTITSDAPGEVHVHGYDLFYELESGVPLVLSFVAEVPGIFEVELEGSHLRLFDIEVTG